MYGNKYEVGTVAMAGDIEREATPYARILDNGPFRDVILHKGASYRLDTDIPALESAESVETAVGIKATLLAELNLTELYTLFIFDRGVDQQGVEAPLGDNSTLTVSDRFLIADAQFLMHARVRKAVNKGARRRQGLAELCAGSNMIFGRHYDNDGLFDTDIIPMEVSGKHAALAIHFDGTIFISDLHSTNLTTVRHRKKK